MAAGADPNQYERSPLAMTLERTRCSQLPSAVSGYVGRGFARPALLDLLFGVISFLT